MKENKCKYCKKPVAKKPEHGISEGIVVLNDGKLAHVDCARDYWIIKSRENKQCE